MPFLRTLYSSSRAREMAQLSSWTEHQKQTFLDAQFCAQHNYYRQQYPDAAYNLITRDGISIGRLYVARTSREINLMDITLLAPERNAGLGTRLVRNLQNEAEQQRKVVTLHVEDENPARRLYDRLGFIEVATVTFYKQMHWIPEGLQYLSEELIREAR